MYLCEMTGGEEYIYKYMILQRSELFHLKVSAGFLRQDSQSWCNFDKIQNLGDLELSEGKF